MPATKIPSSSVTSFPFPHKPRNHSNSSVPSFSSPRPLSHATPPTHVHGGHGHLGHGHGGLQCLPDQTRLSEFRTVAHCLVYFVSGQFQRVQQEQREKYQVLRNPKITKTLTAWVWKGVTFKWAESGRMMTRWAAGHPSIYLSRLHPVINHGLRPKTSGSCWSTDHCHGSKCASPRWRPSWACQGWRRGGRKRGREGAGEEGGGFPASSHQPGHWAAGRV